MDGLGCAYWAITDHSRNRLVPGQRTGRRASLPRGSSDEVQSRSTARSRIAEGSEFRLLSAGPRWTSWGEGRLDFDDDLLAEASKWWWRACTPGSGSNEAENTKRLIRAAPESRSST